MTSLWRRNASRTERELKWKVPRPRSFPRVAETKTTSSFPHLDCSPTRVKRWIPHAARSDTVVVAVVAHLSFLVDDDNAVLDVALVKE